MVFLTLYFWVFCAVEIFAQGIQPVPLKDIKKLLSEEYMNLESGYGQASDGLDVVAASTYMRGVTGEMVDWWFATLYNTDKYKMWHPRDHVYAEFIVPPSGKGNYIGGQHLVKEVIGGELQSLNISFTDPSVYFGDNWKSEFTATNHSTAIIGRVSFFDFATRSSNPVGHLLHLVHDEPDGVRMRSRFWLGDLGVPIEAPLGMSLVPQYLTRGLQKHASEEMAILATFLPKLWRGESDAGKSGKPLRFDRTNPDSGTYAGPFSV